MHQPSTETADVIDAILQTAPDGKIAELRAKKPVLAAELQAYYRSIFAPAPDSAAAFPLVERALVAVRVASFTRSQAVADWYADLAAREGAVPEAIDRARDANRPWKNDTRLGAAMRHADLLTSRVSTARRSDLDALKLAGFTPAGILSLSQTIAFVSYQLRLIAGLRAFEDRP